MQQHASPFRINRSPGFEPVAQGPRVYGAVPGNDRVIHREEPVLRAADGYARGEAPPRRFEGVVRMIQADDPVARVSDGVIRRDEPVARFGEGIIRRDEPVARLGEGIIRRDEPVLRGSDGIILRDERVKRVELVPRAGDGIIQRDPPVARVGDGLIQREEPVARIGDGIIRREEPAARVGDGMIRREEPVVRSSDGIIRRDEPFAKARDGIIRRDEPVARDGIIRRDEAVARIGDGNRIITPLRDGRGQPTPLREANNPNMRRAGEPCVIERPDFQRQGSNLSGDRPVVLQRQGTSDALRVDGQAPAPQQAAMQDARPKLGRGASRGSQGEGETKEHLLQWLTDPKKLDVLVRRRFNEFTRKRRKPDFRGKCYLEFEDMHHLSLELASELQINPSVFGEIGQMFWRFDFSGDGQLDEEEGSRLILLMLRRYRDAVCAPEPGQVRLGGKIAVADLRERYRITKKLGEGGQGVAVLAQPLAGGNDVCVKMYDKSNPSAPLEDITQEFELLIGLKHPRIAHVFEIFQDQLNIYVVQEAYYGGDLTGIVKKAVDERIAINERWLAKIFSQILHGVQFLHSKNIIHCDLKEPNVMIASGRTSDLAAPQIIVIDFGLANHFHSKSSPGGTPGYMPPEAWPPQGLWTPKGDVFSIGVMIFNMRTGISPFTQNPDALSLKEVCERTKTSNPVMDMGTEDLRRMVKQMLDKQFLKRPVTSELLKHPWFDDGGEKENFHASILASLAFKGQKNVLHRAVLAQVAAKENLAQMKELNELFLGIDSDGDGLVSADEVRQCLKSRWPADQVERLIEVLIGDSGAVAYDEFMGQLIASKAPEERALLYSVFQEADADRDGYLTLQELNALLSKPAVEKVLGGKRPADIINIMDRNGNGRITFDDFVYGFYQEDCGCDYRVGQAVEYYSASHSIWVPCEVTAVDAKSGAMQVSAKPGFWMKKVEAGTRVRPCRRRQSAGLQASPEDRSDLQKAQTAGVGRMLFAGGLSNGSGHSVATDVISEGKALLKEGKDMAKKVFKGVTNFVKPTSGGK